MALGNDSILALVGLLLALWLVAATVLIWLGLSARRKAQKTLRQTARLTRLLETGPAVPVVVRSDGKIEVSERLSKILGLETAADSLSGLHDPSGKGIVESDLEALQEHVLNTQRMGSRFDLPIRLVGSERRFLVVGNIADTLVYPNGAALLWFFDLTNNIQELEKSKEQAEEARKAFAALSGLIEEAPIPMWHRGNDLKISLVNNAYVQAVEGESSEQVVADSIELVEMQDGKSPVSFAAEAKQAGVAQERVISNTLDGERRQIKVLDIPLGEAGVAGMAIDMQELEDAKIQFRRLSDAQRDLLDMMSAGVAQFEADQSLVFANSPFQRIFALRDQWLEDKPEFARLLDRMRENGKLPEVRDFPEWRVQRENWFRSTQPNEENWLLPDGTHLRVLAQPLPNGSLLVIFEDRTEQVQLASSRDTLLRVRTATFDNLFEAIAVFASDGRLSIWNRKFAETWGLEEKKLAEHPRLDELLPELAKLLDSPAQISVVGELLRMTTANREHRQARVAFADDRMFQISTVPLPDGNALFAMLDMTDSIQIEQALRDRNEALSEADTVKNKFLANMSYEFRTPLTSISGFADLLKEGIAGDLTDQAQEYVAAISASADRLSQQINTVLDFSQGQAGELPIAMEEVDLASLLEAVLQSNEESAVSRSIALRLDIEGGLPSVSGDSERLYQAISHVVENAITYGNEDGQVLIAAAAQNKVEIVISDDGPGLDEEKCAAIFNASKDGGLGLPLAKQLIEAHDGKLDLRSEVGKGTTVTITLPKP